MVFVGDEECMALVGKGSCGDVEMPDGSSFWVGREEVRSGIVSRLP